MIEDSEGKVVVRDRGSIIHTFHVDTFGDGEPSGEPTGFDEHEVHGPHPGFADDFPFCEVVTELTGA